MGAIGFPIKNSSGKGAHEKKCVLFPKNVVYYKNTNCIEPPSRGLNRAQVHSKNDQGADGAMRSAEQGGARSTDAVVSVRSFPRGVDRMLTQFLKIHKE